VTTKTGSRQGDHDVTLFFSPRAPGSIAAARAVNGSFFVAVAAYCFLAYTPFAYFQFIKPNVLPALTDFVKLTPWLFWLFLLITILTLMEALRGGHGSIAARAYTAAMIAAGVAMMFRPPLADIGNTPRAFVGGLVALVPPMWLAIVDHRIWPPPELRPADRSRALAACLASALAVWGMYALAVPWRLTHAIGIDLPPRELAISLIASLVVHLFVFMALFVALTVILMLARFLGQGRVGHAEYWGFIALLAGSITLVEALLVGASLAFTGREAWVASGAIGAATALVWAGIARVRLQPVASTESRALDSLAAFAAPIAGRAGRIGGLCVLAAVPFVAYGLAAAVVQFDWNFLMQKLGVLLAWLVTLCAVYAAVGDHSLNWKYPYLQGATPLLAFLMYVGLAKVEPGLVLDRYAAVDPSFRLVRDAKTVRSAETAEYYAFLRSQTLVSPRRIQPLDTDFVRPLLAAHGRKPNIFLLVVDSLRRDYVSPYNPAVTFTPEIEKLAADSFVFERAFTRYSGTGMAVPSIWAGGMIIHVVQQSAFARRNTLMKLVDANDYVQMMTVDNIVEGFISRDAKVQRLGERMGKTEFDACRTLAELERMLETRGPHGSPVFFYALPQNVHIATSALRKMPAGERYPGFFDKVAAGVREVDTCVGHFVDYLKRAHLYDDSVIILTSDHGDSLGEEGRWGHAFYLYPEVMRVPLIVHLPSWLKTSVTTDVDAVALSTDIAPTLYALLGYNPRDLGSLFGRPLFVDHEGDLSSRRRESFLIASSYGAVYGMLRDNGRLMYVADTVDGREYAFDLAHPAGSRVEVTQTMTNENRRMIQEQLMSLADLYQYHPEPR
jgi:Sulfatase